MARLRRFSAGLATLILASFAALYVAPRFDAELAALVGNSVDRIRSMLEGATGLTVSFDSLSPSVFKTLSLSRLALRDETGRAVLEARRVIIYVDPAALLAGKADRVVTELRLDDGAVDLAFPRDAALFDRISKAFGSGTGPALLPQLAFTGRRLEARVASETAGVANFILRDFGFASKGREALVSFSGDFALEPAAAGIGPVSGPVEARGALSDDMKRARFELTAGAKAADFEVSPKKFEVVFADRQLKVIKIRDDAPFDAELAADLSDGSVTASLKLDGFAPARSATVSGNLGYLAPWMELPYTGTFEAAAPKGDFASVAYSAKLKGTLPSSFVPGARGAEIVASGDLKGATVDYAKLEIGADTYEYKGYVGYSRVSADGELTARMTLFDGRFPVSATAKISGDSSQYLLRAKSAQAAGVTFTDLSGSIAIREDHIDIGARAKPPASQEKPLVLPRARLSGVDAEDAASPMLSCEGTVSLGKTLNLDLAFTFDDFDMAPVAKVVEALTASPDAAKTFSTVKVGGQVFASSDLSRFAWSAPDLAVVSRAFPGAHALLSLAGNLETVTIRKGLASYAGLSVDVAGKVDFSKPGKLGFEANLGYQDIPYAIKGSLAGANVTISGDYGLKLSVRDSPGGTFVRMSSKDLPVPLVGGIFLVATEAEGRYSSPDDWDLSLSPLEVNPTGESIGSVPLVSVEGLLKPTAIDFRKFRIEDKYSALEGPVKVDYSFEGGLQAAFKEGFPSALISKLAAKATIALTGTVPSIDPSARPGAAGKPAANGSGQPSGAAGAKKAAESYKIEGRIEKGVMDASVALVASPLARLGALPVKGYVDAEGTLKGTVSAPVLGFRANLREGSYLGEPLELGAQGGFADAILTVSRLSGAYTAHRVPQASGSLSLRDGAAKVDVDYSGSLAGEPIAFKLSAEGQSTSDPSRGAKGGSAGSLPALADFLSGYRAEGVATNFSFGSFRSARWPFAATLGAESVSVVGGEGRELSVRYGFDGSFDAAVGAPLPIQLTASGKTDGVNIDANVRGLEFGLTSLNPFIPPSIVVIEEGKAQGAGHIRGLLADPEIDGEFKLAGVVLRVPDWLVDKVGPFDAPILADGRTVIAVSPAMKVGAAAVSARAECTLDHWTPTGLKGTIKSVSGSKVKLQTVLLGIHAQGDANLDLNANLVGDVVSIGGDVALDKAVVVVSPETIAGAPAGPPGEPPTVFLAIATKLRFGRGAQVFFPSRDLPIVAGYAEPSSALNIRYDQAAEDFSVRGEIALRGGDVFYIQRSFFLKSAKLVFNENSTRFDPLVTVHAELRDRNDEGPVLVTLKADNAPIASFKPRLISDPPMTEAQIAELLGENLFGLEADGNLDIRHALISGSEFIPQLNVIKTFERRVRELLGLDIFYLRTRMLQRWLIDLSFNDIAGTNTLGRYLDETSAYAGKYLSDSIFAYGSARLREDPLASTGALRLDWEAGVEFDTPYGLLEWTIAPNNPDSLFITDQSLSLSWRLSY